MDGQTDTRRAGRPEVFSRVDTVLVQEMRAAGQSWAEIADMHPLVASASGRMVKPSPCSIRRAFKKAKGKGP